MPDDDWQLERFDPPRPREPEPAVYSECVIGYRRWMLADWTLVPNSVGDPWRPGINHARCRAQDPGYAAALWAQMGQRIILPVNPGPHTAPDACCDCGLYALHDPHDLFYMRERGPVGFIIGAVAAWGRLRVHWDGFRAEYAQIVALVPPPAEAITPEQARDGLKLLQRIYQVPLVPVNRLQAEAERHGRPLPVDARPWPPLMSGYVGGAAPPVGTMMGAWPRGGMIPVATGGIIWPPAGPGAPAPPPPLGKPPANRQGPPRPKRAPKFGRFGRRPPGT